jgi:hypothetical protein
MFGFVFIMLFIQIHLVARRPTASVTRWWAGQDNAALPEPTSSHANCLKTR